MAKKKYAHPIHISKGNSKLGSIPNISLTPIRSCSCTACRTCAKEGCYALDSYKMYPSVRKAWDENLTVAVFYLGEFEEQLVDYFSALSAPKFFRIHVGGDFVTREYAEMWHRIAKRFPETHFLAFTKQFDLVRGIPFNELDNFALRLSDWPGAEVPEDLRSLYPVAWLDDGTRPEESFPKTAITCPGNCESCGVCWCLKEDTRFYKHGSKAKRKHGSKAKRKHSSAD